MQSERKHADGLQCSSTKTLLDLFLMVTDLGANGKAFGVMGRLCEGRALSAAARMADSELRDELPG